MSSELNDIKARTEGAAELTGGEDIRAHLEWEVREMITCLSPDKLTAQELADLIAVLRPAHARVRVLPSGMRRPLLTIVRSTDSSRHVAE